jgi:hypothetical protein
MKRTHLWQIVGAVVIGVSASDALAYTVSGDTNNYKWYQPPVPGGGPTDIFNGWNQISTEMPHQPMNWQVADDWVCATTNPVTKVRWWGSFANWTETNLPPNLPGMGFPQGFWIIFFNDVPAGLDLPWSHPGGIMPPLARFYTNYTWRYVGKDRDPRGGPDESCFMFEQELIGINDYIWWFYQNNSPSGTNIYWLSILANQWWGTIAPQDHFFGWKTRPRDLNPATPDSAVTYNIDCYTADSGIPCNFLPIMWPDSTGGADMAFELLTAKWEQPPDLTTTGIDVNATSNNAANRFLLADDFQCTTTGPITNITVWGSWRNDLVPLDPANVVFTLSFHTNLPPGMPPNPSTWSMPGNIMWKMAFQPGQFTCSVEQAGLEEWWMDPPSYGLQGGDHICYRYDFAIPTGAFNQQGTVAVPATYWLDVQAQPKGNTGAQFGWKTSATHWMDAACWVAAGEPYNGTGWQMLTNPPGHGWYKNKIDLAFRLNNAPPKWSQPPVIYASTNSFNGWNQYSVYGATNIVADDWVCTNGTPVTDIHWWGSFIGWSASNLPPVMPGMFVISIWDDVPKGAGVPFSHPGVCLTNIYSTSAFPVFAGWDYDPRNPNAPPDACFKYTLDLTPDQWFRQKPGTNTYWLSIAAQYPAGPVVDYPWGWKTRPRDTNSLALDDAVRIFAPTAPAPGVPYGDGTNIWWPTADKSWDMAFSLTTRDLSNCVQVICSSNITVYCAPTNGAIVNYYSYATNVCTGELLPVTCTPASGSRFAVGSTQVWCTNITAGVTNFCFFFVSVLTDTNPPLIHCSTNIIANTDPGLCSKSNVTFVVTATDDCDPAPVITCSPTNGSTFPKGVTTVYCTATDAAGNSTNCSFTVTIKDSEAPVVHCPSNIITNTDPGQCSSTNVMFAASVTDNCSGATVTCLPASGSSFPKGVTTVTCTGQDASGNTTKCSFTVTVLDKEAPSIRCSTNIVVDSPTCAPVVVNYPAAIATDNCGVTNVTCVPPAGSLFPLGTNTVQCTAWDSSGNSSSCSFTITVRCLAKWAQLPDLTPAGFDVRALRPKILANDFPCTKSGLVTNIHIWASWLNDYADPNATFQLGFWTDIPRGAGVGVELVTNGTFELAFTNAGTSGALDGAVDFIPPSWNRQETFSGQVLETSAIRPVAANGPSAPGVQAASFYRTNDNFSGDWTAIYQNVAINATQYLGLTLSLDTRLWWHTLWGGGSITPAFEWPAIVEIDYLTTNGVTQIWRHGWYLDPPGDGVRVNDPGQGLIPFYNDTLVPQGAWVSNKFDLLAELPQLKTITRILVGGSGHTFWSEVDNVSIQGTVRNSFSQPGKLLWQGYFAPPQYTCSFYSTNRQPFFDPNLGEVIGSETNVWEYNFPVHANDAFFQTNSRIYWLSVSAQSQNYFGWKTAATNWNDDAVYGHVDSAWLPLGDWLELLAPQQARSLDLAFSLITLPVVIPPVITNVVVTNQVTLLATNQVVGLAWTSESNLRYQVYRTPSLGVAGDGSDIVWTPCGPEIIGPTQWYWETNAVLGQRFYRVLAIDP